MTTRTAARSRKLAAEALGTAFLLATVVSSGVMGESLAGGNLAIALLANTIATGAILAVLFLIFGGLSGAHFNPAVTVARSLTDTFSGIRPVDAPGFIVAELAGAVAATAVFHWLLTDPPKAPE